MDAPLLRASYPVEGLFVVEELCELVMLGLADLDDEVMVAPAGGTVRLPRALGSPRSQRVKSAAGAGRPRVALLTGGPRAIVAA